MKSILYPLSFKPIFQERIWGGRNIEALYKKELPPQIPIGESWEISDRPEAQSVVVNGPLAGKTLHWILENQPCELLGKAEALKGRFPLLVKILDAREKLSLQVHPPASKAASLSGEPKTEMWYITKAEPDAKLYAGLRTGTTKAEFEKRIQNGTVEECFHQIEVRAGDTMFLPSGRVHAIGAGLLIYEIQQNSDTTYRVFDWNRTDAQGQPRQLHIKESLECIDFEDFEPRIVHADNVETEGTVIHIQTLVGHPLFNVELVTTASASHIDYSVERPRIVGVVEGEIRIEHEQHPLNLRAGQFCLIPAEQKRAKITGAGAARFLVAQPG